jgi:hypothetical protein
MLSLWTRPLLFSIRCTQNSFATKSFLTSFVLYCCKVGRCPSKFRKIANPQIWELKESVRFAGLPQMWHFFADLQFADPLLWFLDFRLLEFRRDWKIRFVRHATIKKWRKTQGPASCPAFIGFIGECFRPLAGLQGLAVLSFVGYKSSRQWIAFNAPHSPTLHLNLFDNPHSLLIVSITSIPLNLFCPTPLSAVYWRSPSNTFLSKFSKSYCTTNSFVYPYILKAVIAQLGER